MANGYIRLPPDSSGKMLRSRTSTESGNEVHDEIVELADSSQNIINPAKEDGNLAVVAAKDFTTETTLSKLLAFNAVTKIMYVDEPDTSTTYQGWANAGTAASAASWMIRKIVKSGNVTSILWCDGDQNYNNIWDNRASLNYS